MLIQALQWLSALAVEFWALVRPGGVSYELHWVNFIASNGHYVLEACLVGVILALILQKGRPSGREEPLTEKEVEQLCKEWQPAPLCPPVTASQRHRIEPVISRTTGIYVEVDGLPNLINFSSTNFLGLSGQTEILEACKETLNKYGCGSCGPRGFYGTIDVHLDLEEALSKFMGTEEAIIYSYDLATLPSIIPAFANRKDLIICDEGVNYSIQNGCKLSRGHILTFKHNDVADLERVMETVAADDRKHKRKLNRKYVVVEGIYSNFGDLAPLDRIFELKEKYKYRLIVDESLSLGVLGETGRGACEHFGILGRVEIVAASMGNSLASIGGFCCGNREICDHQRLSGSGYCFSASLPPYLATAALGALHIMASDGQSQIERVQSNAAALRSQLSHSLQGLRVWGGEEDLVSPVIMLILSEPPEDSEVALELLEAIVEDCKLCGVLLSVNHASMLDAGKRLPPSICVLVTARHTPSSLAQVTQALVKSWWRVQERARKGLLFP